MDIRDKLVTLTIPSLKTPKGNGYISAGSRQGGSYLSNYHKSLPRLLLGSLNSATDTIFISCDDIKEDVYIEVRGIIENEYLLNDIELYVNTYQGEFMYVERVPYAEWSFNISALSIYTSNFKRIELELVGTNSEGFPVTVKQYIPVTIEEDCFDVCEDATVEAYAGFEDIRVDTPFKISVNGEIISSTSLYELKEALLNKGVEFIIYQRIPQ